jgi:hypothetical protein
VVPEATIYDYRGAVPDTGASTVRRLGPNPLAARELLLGQLEEIAARRAATTITSFPAIRAR